MRNIIRTALIVGTLATPMITMADTPKKDAPAAKDTKDAKADTKDAAKTDAKDAAKTDAKDTKAPAKAKKDTKKDVKEPAAK
ncbi:MAG TPA: hypothetical protein VFK02_01435 [Kofleriaceae bacterium]|nr:hypothetical protein [Kofleriaceae bacterium]